MSYLSPASRPLRIVCFLSNQSSKFLENTGTPISISRKYPVKSNNKKNYSMSEFHQKTTDPERKFEYTEP